MPIAAGVAMTVPTLDLSRIIRVAEGMPFNAYLGLSVRKADPGHVEVVLPWSEAVANTYDSVHAVAVIGPAELASGMALLTALGRADVAPVARGLSVQYRAAAKGDLVATAVFSDSAAVAEKLDSSGRADVDVPVDVTDPDGTVVAVVMVTWALRARPTQSL